MFKKQVLILCIAGLLPFSVNASTKATDNFNQPTTIVSKAESTIAGKAYAKRRAGVRPRSRNQQQGKVGNSSSDGIHQYKPDSDKESRQGDFLRRRGQ